MVSKKKNGFQFDPRVNLLTVVLTASLMFILQGEYASVYLFVVVISMAALNCKIKIGIKYTVIFIFVYGLSLITRGALQVLIKAFVLRGVSLGAAVTVMIHSADTSKIIVSLRQMKLPEQLLIPFSVMLRFFSTLIQDIKLIRFGMKTRGISLIGKSPVMIYELYLVPVIMRMVKTAGNLSAAAETRGISWKGEKTSYEQVRFRVVDAAAAVILTGIYTFLFITQL